MPPPDGVFMRAGLLELEASGAYSTGMGRDVV